MNCIIRNVYVKRRALINPVSYIRATNAQNLQFRFCDFKIPEGTEVRAYVQKPSGRASYNNATVEGDSVIVEVTTQMFSETGQCYLQLHLVKEEKTLVTFAQVINVLPNYTEGDAVESRNESGFFSEYETKLDEAIDAANEAVDEIGTQAANAANNAADEALNAANLAAGQTVNAANAANEANAAAREARNSADEAKAVKEQIQQKADNGEFTSSIKVGAVTTGKPGTKASVENVGTAKEAVLDFVIPKGDTGNIENIDDVAVDFLTAEKRENVEPGDSFKTIFGKVKRFFFDLKTVAFTGKFSDLSGAPQAANNLNSNSETDYLAAAQGAKIAHRLAELNGKSYADGYIFVELGAVPNKNVKNIDVIGIPSDAKHAWIDTAWAKKSTSGLIIPLPYVDTTSTTDCIRIVLYPARIQISTAGDWSYYDAWAVVAYKL